MAETSMLNLQYSDMETEVAKLSQYVSEFESITQSMNTSVNNLCDAWVSAATEDYRQDFLETTGNFSRTLEIVTMLIQSTNDYIAEMQGVDQKYAVNKVN